MTRKFDPARLERMDIPQPLSSELKEDLENLRKLNRWFGSYRLIRHFLPRWIKPGGRVRILDLATGSGDIPRMIVRWCRERGIAVEIDAVDFQPATLYVARRRSEGFSEISYHEGDIRTFRGRGKWDIVLCSLALHHFSDADAVQILHHARELSHGQVLIADLCRSASAKLGIWLVTKTIFRQPMTRHDARMSIDRAFSFGELRAIAEKAGWEDFGHQRFAVARQAVWWKAIQNGK